jgi:hypothetical protein
MALRMLILHEDEWSTLIPGKFIPSTVSKMAITQKAGWVPGTV